MKPNPQLVEALDNSPHVTSHVARWDSSMASIAEILQTDNHVLRSPSYARQKVTIAAMMAYDSTVRDMAVNAGINVRVFDDIVTQVGALMQTHANRPPSGAAIAKILCKLSRVPS